MSQLRKTLGHCVFYVLVEVLRVVVIVDVGVLDIDRCDGVPRCSVKYRRVKCGVHTERVVYEVH